MIRTPRTRPFSTLRSALLATLLAAPVVVVAPATSVQAATGDLILSEYIEGSGFNKAIEIYNGTGAPVDLSAYTLELYSNGAATPSQSSPLAGTVADGDVWVLANSQAADATIQAEADVFDNGVINFNGDDAVVLRSGGVVVDSFGQVGVDPGSQWPGGGQNDTLVRQPTVCAGDTDPLDAFDASAEWQVLAQDTVDNLGAHTADCGGGAALSIDCGAAVVTDVGIAASTTITASDGDDTVVAMSLVSDDVQPAGSLTAGTFTDSTAVGEPAMLDLDLDDLAEIGSYTATVEAQNSAGEAVTCDLAIDVESDVIDITPIHAVQGAGADSPLEGAVVTIEGVIVGDFQDGAAGVNGDLNGFFVQEEDADADGDPLTSEGIFVFDGSSPAVDVAIGDLVQVEGEVSEFNGMTQMTSFSGVSVVSSGNAAPTAAVGSLPVSSLDDFEAFEGMSVTFPQALVISEYFNFDRFGEIALTSQRNLTPTAEVEPGPDAIAEAEAYLLDRITLDDGRTAQNPDPAIHPNGSEFDLTNLFRGGDTVANATGVLNFSFGLYRVQPTQGADYTSVNARPAAPDAVGGRLQVATFNVLNYFTTLDGSGPICGPNADQNCRGADDAEELTRQRDKIISAIAAIDADVVGLIEIENNATDGPTADLVAGLNDVVGAGTYDYVVTGAVGTDAIRVAIVFKPASVTPSGAFAVLDSSVDPRFDDDKNRPALAQTFVENATGSAFTVVVNHFKSKGSPCDDVGDPNDGQGGGNCNGVRTQAAEALVDWLATDPTGSGDADVLIIGDLNAYDKEDPIDALLAGGYSDLIRDYLGEAAYSYQFDGQIGYLDYQLASASMSSQVTGTTVWHINADEPDAIDYDTSFKQDAQDAIYAPDAFRSSDHDPVIVGLDLDVAAPATARDLKEMARDGLADSLPTGSVWSDFLISRAIDRIDRSLDSSYWLDDSTLDPKQGWRVFVNEAFAATLLSLVRGSAEGDAQAAIDKLIAADDLLANEALSIAIATGGDQRDIDRAERELDRAAADLDRGRYDRAIGHYLRAWSFSVRAVEDARFATYNASLNRFNEGDLVRELGVPGSPQPAAIAEVIQRNRPEVVLVNEFDYDAGGVAAARFQQNYLSVSQNGADPIVYPYRYTAPSNTGIASGFDLDNSGGVGGPGDAFGFGFFPGQFGMVVYSMHPIDVDEIRTFQNFLWKDMPGALLPDDPSTPEPADWYSSEELDVFRLSSKSHWDVPIWVGDRKVHFLVSHPTPPVFDGPEDRNGTRNFDEIRFWADYVAGGNTGDYIYDDSGSFGGLSSSDRFVIAGDQNSDPFDGDSIPGAIQQLLDSPKVNTSTTPSSPGGAEQAALQGGANDSHLSDPAFDTADFNDSGPGNLRADYVLPSRTLKITDAGVFWPESTDPLFALVGTFPFPTSDHRLVWVDVDV